MRLLLTLLLSTSAIAQQPKPLLDLGSGPKAPEAGTGAAAGALVEDMRRQADEIGHRAGATTRDQARAAARAFIRQLAATGEAAGQRGSQRLLIARTLARGLREIDSRIPADGAPGSSVSCTLLRDDLELAAAALTPDADPWRVTRDAFATITQLAPQNIAGWPEDPHLDAALILPFGAEIELWAKLPGVSAEAAATLRELDAITTTAESWTAYGPAARQLRAAVRSAAGTLQSPISYLPDAAKKIMGEQFSGAVLKLDKDDRREAGLVELRRLAHLGRIAARAGEVEDQGLARKIRLSLIQLMGSSQPDLGGEARTLEAFERGLDLLASKGRLPDERDLARQLRPLNRALVPTLRDAERKLLAALPDLLTRLDAMTDPGVLATISAYKRAVRDLEIIGELNAAMIGEKTATSGEPVVSDRWKRIADRVLKLGQDAARPELRESALEAVRGMGEQIAQFTKLPGEDSLRDSAQKAKNAAPDKPVSTAWTALTGGREGSLVSEISDRRGGWLDGWDRAGYAGSAGEVQRLMALRELMGVLDVARGLIETGPGSATALNSWAGWEISGDGLKALAPDLAGMTSEATRMIVEGEAATCVEQVNKIREQCAGALLAARLARAAAESKQVFPADAMLEAGCGGPVAGVHWMARFADELADVCRYADEVAAAQKLGAASRAEAMLKFIGTRANAVQDALK